MPSYKFSHEHSAFVKVCSHCKTITVGTKDQDQSYKMFCEVFSKSTGAGMADGLQSRCWACNNQKRRELGVTRPMLEDMFLAQHGQCAICAKRISIVKNADSTIHANVDHDQRTGTVRELLCGDCNRGIGLLQHSVGVLKSAIAYLEKHQAADKVVIFRRRA